MDEKQKDVLRERVHDVTAGAAKKTAAAAKSATGWKKWALIIATAILALIAGLTQVGCGALEHVTPEQVQDAHGLYHAVTGKPCVFEEGGK